MSAVQGNPARVQELWRKRPRSRVLRATLWTLGLWTLYSWFSPEIGLLEFFDSRRFSNLDRFVEKELVPFPMRGEAFSPQALFNWVADIWNRIGMQSTLATLQISIIATFLAGVAALPLSMLAARNLTSAHPFEDKFKSQSLASRFFWTAATSIARVPGHPDARRA